MYITGFLKRKPKGVLSSSHPFMLQGYKILLGVTGSIAAYKAAYLIRLLVKNGAEVKVIMTKDAQDFIGPITLSVLSKNDVCIDFVSEDKTHWNNHVELGLWADLYLIAPATANTISKMAQGQSDNLLTAAYLSAKCPVWVAPAMDLDMFRHPSTKNNLSILENYGNKILPVEQGELASGLNGEGRMAEPDSILDTIQEIFQKDSSTSKKKTDLAGKRALVSAGPTLESIDPVRFIGNRSSGKMGYAIALELANRGAAVQLVSGPTKLSIEHANIVVSSVESAAEMYEKCITLSVDQDIIIMAAAVADFTPEYTIDKKIKKNGHDGMLKLKPTLDILEKLGDKKKKEQFLVGFALETDNEVENAIVKVQKKNLDLIVLNSLNDPGAGFDVDTNKIKIIDSNNTIQEFELKTKNKVAKDLVDQIINRISLPIN